MKALAVLLGVLMLVVAASGAAIAQAQNQPGASGSGTGSGATPGSGSVSGSGSASGSGSVSSPSATDSRGPSANVDIKAESRKNDSTVRSSDGQNGGSAFPRSAGSERTTIFGLSPTAAVIIAAALLVVVILAIVAMTRSGDTTYVERDRRL
jgi:cobalamin biosynthesis Mg chelatase CobN